MTGPEFDFYFELRKAFISRPNARIRSHASIVGPTTGFEIREVVHGEVVQVRFILGNYPHDPASYERWARDCRLRFGMRLSAVLIRHNLAESFVGIGKAAEAAAEAFGKAIRA